MATSRISDNVYAQRDDSAGRAVGSNFVVNSNELEQQFEPTVAMDLDGDFVIAWSGYGDHSGYGIFAQRGQFQRRDGGE